VRLADLPSILHALDGVLLHQDPAVAALLQRPDELVSHIRMVRQRHFRGRESSHAAERLQTEDRGKMLLPRAHVQAKVLRRCGWGYRVAQELPNHSTARRYAGLQVILRRLSMTSSRPIVRSPCNKQPE